MHHIRKMKFSTVFIFFVTQKNAFGALLITRFEMTQTTLGRKIHQNATCEMTQQPLKQPVSDRPMLTKRHSTTLATA